MLFSLWTVFCQNGSPMLWDEMSSQTYILRGGHITARLSLCEAVSAPVLYVFLTDVVKNLISILETDENGVW